MSRGVQEILEILDRKRHRGAIVPRRALLPGCGRWGRGHPDDARPLSGRRPHRSSGGAGRPTSALRSPAERGYVGGAVASAQDRDRFIAWLREELPRLLREDSKFASEVVGILAQTLSPRAELSRILEEIRDLRREFGERFEAMDRRFEVQAKALWELRVGLGSLGRRFGLGFEEAVRAIVEEFAGLGPLAAERLVLRDEADEVFGVKGQAVEFDAFVHDSRRFLVEAKGFAEPEEVLNFFRKVELARQLGIHVLAAEEPESP